MYEVDILHPFQDMAKLYGNPNAESENWLIRTFEITRDNWQAIMRDGIPVGTYVSLNCKKPVERGMFNSCMMSNTPMELFTNQKCLNNASGNVLIAGLGIGLLPASLADKESVTSITIIELEQEVIDLVEPLFRANVKNADKIKIIKADAYDYPNQYSGEPYDYVYLDIWPEFPGSENDLDMLETLIAKYVPICPSCKIEAWGYEFAEAGLDDSPVEVDAYFDYLVSLQQLKFRQMCAEIDVVTHDDIDGKSVAV